RVHSRQQRAFDVVDGVDQARIHLDLTSADDPHRARLADPALVVAVDVGAHGELRLVLPRVEQLADLRLVLDRVPAAADRAGDRAGLDPAPGGDADIHLRAGADQILRAAKIDEEAVGR